MKITIDSIKKTVLLAGGLFLSVLSINADNNSSGLTPEMLRPQFANLTPEAASLGRYGAFQVSEYSGAANISIPLYTVKSGDVSFPITLYYDATGIKVEQDATFVGLGWNLIYGGMISHIVCGKDDFQETSSLRSVKYYKDFWKNPYPHDVPSQCYFQHNVKMSTRWDDGPIPWWYTSSYLDQDKWKFFINLAQGYDIPDVFQANFCGHSFAFVIDCRNDFKVKIIDGDSTKHKITYTSTGAPNNYPKVFTITDDKGISYQFSPYTENVSRNTYTNVDSYYLTKIYGPDGESGKSVVRIEYDQITTLYGKGSRPQSKTQVSNTRRIKSSNDIAAYNIGQNSYPQDIGCYQTGETYKVYPKKIITALETIEFSLGDRTDLKGAKSIDTITIESNIGSAKKYICFAYDYFREDSPKADYSGKRLKLTGVTIDGQKYKFQYDDKAIPAFSSYSKDYWGYYNGANPNAVQFNASTPAYSISNGVLKLEEHFDGSNRLASEKLCNVGMLKKVIYPTGGYTCYEYEANRFNDKYYYPDASSNNPQTPTSHTDFDVSMYGTMTQTKTFTASLTNYDMKIIGNINGTSDAYTVTVKNASGSVVKTLNYQGKKQLSENISLSLTKGTSYTVEMKLTAAEANRYSTVAQCILSHDATNTVVGSPTTKNEKGGYSIGGGVRVKTIKNYDSDGTYLNGVVYEYSGGKLLSPTVQIEKHFLDFPYETCVTGFDGTKETYSVGSGQYRFSFYYANTEPSYPYYCSVGIPATVGYDQVVKKEIDKSGNVLRKTVFDFYNYGYVTDHSSTNQINERMQNCFFFNSFYDYNSDHAQGHMNGKLKKETIYNGTVLASTTQYKYESVRQGFVQYPKCYPLYLQGYYVLDMKYDFAIYTKFNAWSYLTEKKETLYDSNGKQTTGNITQYAYNDYNHQPSQQTVTDGTNSMRTDYTYSCDKKISGYSHLVNKHNLSELMAVETYRNGTFTGGSKYIYTTHKNPQTGVSFPVVQKCNSVLPNASKSNVTEMTVTSYDDYGNIREYKKKNGTPVTIIWSYNHQLPIMEIVGCTYDEACKKATSLSSLESKASVAETTISSIHSTLMKGLPNAYVTAYTYSPWQSVSQIIKPNGEKTVYSYDSYGRLTTVLDANQSTFQPIQMYNYNYKNK